MSQNNVLTLIYLTINNVTNPFKYFRFYLETLDRLLNFQYVFISNIYGYVETSRGLSCAKLNFN